MKNAVVTGASSMIASHLIEILVQKNIGVLALVRPKSTKKGNIPLSEMVKIVECDISDIDSLNTEERYDAFFHFAWEGTSGSGRDDAALQERNVQNTLKAMRLAERLGAKVFVTAGSQAEYGVTDKPLTPDTPLAPLNEYGRAKARAAQRVDDECSIIHVHGRILSVYGEGDNDFTLVSTAIKKMLLNEETAFTDGTQMWDYLFAGDCAEAFYLMAERSRKNTTYVVGSGECRPLREYIQIIAEETGYKKEIGFGKVPQNPKGPKFLCADISALRNIGFEPRTDFRSGIRKTLKKKRYL